MIDDAEDLKASMNSVVNDSSTGNTIMVLFTTLLVIIIGITIQGYVKSIIRVRYWLDIFTKLYFINENKCN